MLREFDIISIFERTFGYRPKPYRIQSEQVNKPPVSQPGNDKPRRLSTYVQNQPSTSGLNYEDVYKDPFGTSGGRSIFLPVWLNGYMLPFPVVEISLKNNIVETVMVNRSGTVKEYISAEDYQINIKGIIIREDGQYPETEIMQLKAIAEWGQAMPIRNALTDIFLSHPGEEMAQVVVTDLKFPATVGVKNAKAYELNLLSDQAFELYVQ